jgi:hypothetical protein
MSIRNFTFEHPIDDELQQSAAESLAQRLTDRWNQIDEELEHKSWQAQDDYYAEREQDFLESILSEAEDDEAGQAAVNAYLASKAQRELSLRLEQETIEGQLAQIGARMMRPYEHWNEEEAYIEYNENRYSERY